MKLTTKQKRAILPLLQMMVQSMIDVWDLQRRIEQALDKDFRNMNPGAEMLAFGYASGYDVKLKDVQGYIDNCEAE